MRQTGEILLALRQELKVAGKTYADLARHLEVSENSVKRLFSQKKVTLYRLEQIVDFLGLEIVDLVRRAEKNIRHIDQLSEEQERFIVSDVKLLLVAISVIHGWTFEELIETYKFSEPECIKLLISLDKLKVLELLPLNRFKLTVSKKFAWRKGGPVQQYFRQSIERDFFDSDFDRPGEQLVFRSGMLSRESNALLQKKIETLIAEFNELHEQDSTLPLSERFGSSIVLALRPWEFSGFTALRRNKNQKVF